MKECHDECRSKQNWSYVCISCVYPPLMIRKIMCCFVVISQRGHGSGLQTVDSMIQFMPSLVMYAGNGAHFSTEWACVTISLVTSGTYKIVQIFSLHTKIKLVQIFSRANTSFSPRLFWNNSQKFCRHCTAIVQCASCLIIWLKNLNYCWSFYAYSHHEC